MFIPDIAYRTGYPGKSAYDAIIPGVRKIVDMGFVDPRRVGNPGQSWGGYQTAFLTHTDQYVSGSNGRCTGLQHDERLWRDTMGIGHDEAMAV